MGASAAMPLTIASTFFQMQAAQTQARGLEAQGAYAKLQAKQESLKYKQNAVAVLDNILQTSATITAKAAMGGVDPFSGSAKALRDYAVSRGVQELYTLREGEVIALAGGRMQEQQYGAQAAAARQAGFASAIGSLGYGLQMQQSIGGPSGTTT
tara:strand:- start:7090 stop:7551 length:462 start_codon:yes stop_codon:yes gene_type:complete